MGLSTITLTCSLILSAGAAGSGATGSLVSPFNQRVLEVSNGSPHDFSFLVAGHLYGCWKNFQTVYPSSSVLANIDEFNRTEADLFVGLGDLFRNGISDQQSVENFIEDFAWKLRMPFVNAAGNHDVGAHAEHENIYRKQFGETYFAFDHCASRFIVLDTNLDSDFSITGSQLAFFRECVAQTGSDPAVHNVFIFMHHGVWAIDVEGFELVDSQHGYALAGRNNFKSVILPVLRKLSLSKPVYVFSGDNIDLPLIHATDPDYDELHFVATNIGDTRDDVALQVHVSNSGKVKVAVLPLSGQPARPYAEYAVQAWAARLEALRRRDSRLWSDAVRKFREVLSAEVHVRGLQVNIYGLGFISGILPAGIIMTVLTQRRKRRHIHREPTTTRRCLSPHERTGAITTNVCPTVED